MTVDSERSLAGLVPVSRQLLEDRPWFDAEAYIRASLARAAGLQLDAEAAELLRRMNWRPTPLTRRQRARRRVLGAVRARREAVALWVAPWLYRPDDW